MDDAAPTALRSGAAGVPVLPLSPLGETADQRSRRSMREMITIGLIGLLSAVFALAFIALLVDADPTSADKRFTHLKALLEVVVGPLITLLSTVIGFYFGTQSVRIGSETDKSDA